MRSLELRKRGHDVVFATHKELTELLNNPSYAAKATEIGGIIQAQSCVGVACDAIEKQLRATDIS